jgi:Cys-rich protein (TIGR01571 family)
MAYKPLAAVAGAVGAVMGNRPNQGPPHWQVDIGTCMDDTNVCLQTWCCLPCTVSNMMNMRERGVPQCDPLYCCGATCLGYLTYGWFFASFGLGTRRELLQRYGIVDEPYCTSVVYNILLPCNLCMLQREMALRGEHPGGVFAQAPNANNETQQQFAMVRNIGKTMATGSSWGSTLFQCAGFEDCVDGWCMSCCTLAHMAHRLDAGRVQLIPRDAPNNMDPVTCVGATCMQPAFHYAVRRELVDRYQIPEPHLVSFVLTAFCSPCSVSQTRREMGYRGEWPGGIMLKNAPFKGQ